MAAQRSFGNPAITGSTVDELRQSMQFWLDQVYNHLDALSGARGTPQLLSPLDANGQAIHNLPDPTTNPLDNLDSMSAVPRKFATPLARQPDGSFAWDCRFIPMINDTYAEFDHGVPPLQQIRELIQEAVVGVSAQIPVGAIMLWSGSVASIPTGFTLCDGSAGTPDLRDKFIAGAGGSYDPGDTGGTDAQSTTTGTPSSTVLVDNDGALSTVLVGDASHTHDVAFDNRPQFYALCYIMKV